MFSQWRQAVESLATPHTQHSPKPSQDSVANDQTSRSSLDTSVIRQSLSSSTLLAESALTNLKKTLASPRPASPGSNASANGSPSSRVGRTTLEDRLRAKFAIGDASSPASTNTSARSTPSRVGTPVTEHPLSPTSTPLPDSPAPSMELKRPFSPASVPLPESPALLPTRTSQEETLSHPLVESFSHPIPGGGPSSTSEDKSDQEAKLVAEDKDVELLSTQEHPTNTEDNDDSLSQEQVVQANDSNGPSSEEPTPQSEVLSSDTLEVATPQEDNILDTSVVPDDIAESEEAAATESTLVNAIQETGVPQEEETQLGPVILPQGVSITSDTSTDESKLHPPDHISPEPITDRHAVSDDIGAPQIAEVAGLSSTVDVEALQKRLKLVEQRFADVSTSFKRLQAEKVAVDRVLRELTPLETVQETEALRDYLQNMNLKTEMAQDEIRRLTGKLTRQEERIEELRDIHRLESKSQSEQIEKLRAQVDEVEALLKASEASITQKEEESAKQKAEVDRLQAEVGKIRESAKDEEEKRTKAVSLLKTVRQKLVKAEKERDDALKDAQALRDREKDILEKERAEQQRLLDEVQKANSEREVAVTGLRAQFDKEVASLKDRHEKETSALRGQLELEIITLKASHSKELESRDTRIVGLERTVQNLSREKDDLFDQLQMRQAELESSQSLLESLQGQTVELQYQLREANDRIALLNEELMDARSQQTQLPHEPMPSTEEVSRLLSTAESKYETRIAELRRHITIVERERDEAETDWSRKLAEKIKEVESLRAILDSSAKSQEEAAGSTNLLKEEIQRLQDEIRTYQVVISDLRAEAGRVTELEAASQTQMAEVNAQVNALRQQYEESKAKEAQLKALNKTLRDELRKVQSSAALLEKQRNPGVGYWAARSQSTADLRSPRSSTSDLPSQESPSRPGTPTTALSDEDVNFEYLRNVILQFLEHKEMRPHLVRILSTILRFTPEETRKLISKV